MTKKQLITQSLFLLSLIGLGLSFTGCAQDVGVIDRTFPEKLKKSIFMNDDQWYFMQTVVGTDFQGSGGVFEGLQGSVKRIRWTVTENTLFAHNVLEPSIGSSEGLVDQKTRRLGVVAAFPIKSHFDVQRGYNTSTGQLSNVITENSSDRLWQDREYMRVDWSSNQIDGVGLIDKEVGALATFSRTVPEAGNGDVSDYNRTRIHVGDGYKTDTIDTVTEYYFEPDVYACFGLFGLDGVRQCAAGPVSVRNFFMKIGDRAKKFEPLLYPDVDYLKDDNDKDIKVLSYPSIECTPKVLAKLGETGKGAGDCERLGFPMFNRFGYFRTERNIYTSRRESGLISHRRYFANIWNIWQTAYDDQGKLIPLKDRKPKQIVYYLSPGFPETPAVQEGVKILESQWNQVLLKTIYLTHRDEVDNASTTDKEKADYVRDKLVAPNNGGDKRMYRIERNSCSGVKIMEWKRAHASSLSKEAVTLLDGQTRESIDKMPVESLKKFCAKLEFYTREAPKVEDRFDWERPGDIRYSFITWDYNNAPWLGYGPVGTDPMTGEILTGTANFAGQLSASYATLAADIILFQAGRYSDLSIMTGEYRVDDPLDKAEIEKALAAERENLVNSVGLRSASAGKAGKSQFAFTPTDPNKTYNLLREGQNNTIDRQKLFELYTQHSPQSIDNGLQQFMKQADVLMKTKEEKVFKLISDPDFLAGMLRDKSFADNYVALSSLYPNKDGEITKESNDEFLKSFTMPLHSMEQQEKLNQFYAMRNILSTDMLDQAILHLTESYKGAVPYFKNMTRQEIEQEFVKRVFYSTELHEVGHTMGLRHNFTGSADVVNYHPGYWERKAAVDTGSVPADQLDYSLNIPDWSKINENEDSFVRDDWAPLVKDLPYFNQAEYREAAIMDYTPGLVSGSTGLGRYENAAIQFAYAHQIEQFKQPLDDFDRFRIEQKLWPYETTWKLFDPTDENVGVKAFTQDREWIPVTQAMEAMKKEYAQNTKVYETGGMNALGANTAKSSIVPYRFCTDSHRGGALFCDVFDYGANYHEIVNYYLDDWRVNNIQNRFVGGRYYRMRQKLQGYIRRLTGTIMRAQRTFLYYSYYGFYEGVAPEFYDDLRSSAVDGVNFIAEILAQPNPGDYCLQPTNVYSQVSNRNPLSSSCVAKINVPYSQGSNWNTAYTQDYELAIRRVGSFFGKLLASQALFSVTGVGNIYSQSFNDNIKSTNYSFWSKFRDQMYDLTKNVVLGSDQVYTGFIDANGDYHPPYFVYAKQLVDPTVPSPDMGLPRVHVATGDNFAIQRYFIALNLLINNTTLDDQPDVIQYMKVCGSNTECDNECIYDPSAKTWVPNAPNVKECRVFTHPFTSQSWVAPIGPDGKSIIAGLFDQLDSIKQEIETTQLNLQAHPTDIQLINRMENLRTYLEYSLSLINTVRDIMKKSNSVY